MVVGKSCEGRTGLGGVGINAVACVARWGAAYCAGTWYSSGLVQEVKDVHAYWCLSLPHQVYIEGSGVAVEGWAKKQRSNRSLVLR